MAWMPNRNFFPAADKIYRLGARFAISLTTLAIAAEPTVQLGNRGGIALWSCAGWRDWQRGRRMSRKMQPGGFGNPTDALNYEIVQEQAAALGRLGRRLEDALRRLREFDAAHPAPDRPAEQRAQRAALVAEAGYALWMFVVQREACGLRDSRMVMRDYGVPPEVQACQAVIKGQ